VDDFEGQRVYDIPHGSLVANHAYSVLSEGKGDPTVLQKYRMFGIDVFQGNPTTADMANRMTEALAAIYQQSVQNGKPITRFVFNMSFNMIPCAIAADFGNFIVDSSEDDDDDDEKADPPTFDDYIDLLLQRNDIDLNSPPYNGVSGFRERFIALLLNPAANLDTDKLGALVESVCVYGQSGYGFQASTQKTSIYRLLPDSGTLLPSEISPNINAQTVSNAFYNGQRPLCASSGAEEIVIVGFIGSSGNFAADYVYYPAAFPEVRDVGASLSPSDPILTAEEIEKNEVWEYSNRAGTYSPGAYFTLPFLQQTVDPSEVPERRENSYFGTSFAAPNVSIYTASALQAIQPEPPRPRTPSGQTEGVSPQFEWDAEQADVYNVTVRAQNGDVVRRFSVLPEECARAGERCAVGGRVFSLNTSYSWTVVASRDGVASPISDAVAFNLIPDTPPTVVTTTPADNAFFNQSDNVRITFDEPVNTNGSVYVEVDCPSYATPAQRTNTLQSNTVISFDIPTPAVWEVCKVSVLASAVSDVTDNPLDGNSDGTGGDDYNFSFVVRNPLDPNNDFRITPADVLYVVNRLGTTNAIADVDASGLVDQADVDLITDSLGQQAPTS